MFALSHRMKTRILVLGAWFLGFNLLCAANAETVTPAKTVMVFYTLFALSIPLALIGESLTVAILMRHKRVKIWKTFFLWLLMSSCTFLIFFLSLRVHPVLVGALEVVVMILECEIFRRFLYKRVQKNTDGEPLAFGYCFIVTLLGNLMSFFIHITPALYLAIELR
jgi:hypothetical protein